MNRTIKTTVFAFAVAFPIFLAGCKSDEEKVLGMMEEQADIIDKNKDDCDKMAEGLTKWKESNGEAYKKLAEKMKGGSKEDAKKMEEKYGERLKGIMTKMMSSMSCSMKNEKVAKALKMD